VLRILGALAALFAATVAIDQLWTQRRVSADVLLVEMDEVDRMNSLRSTSVPEVSEGRVEVKRWQSGRLTKITYWAPLSEFPADVAANLVAGQRPYGGPWEKARKPR
jgi:hypothetical protein